MMHYKKKLHKRVLLYCEMKLKYHSYLLIGLENKQD